MRARPTPDTLNPRLAESKGHDFRTSVNRDPPKLLPASHVPASWKIRSFRHWWNIFRTAATNVSTLDAATRIHDEHENTLPTFWRCMTFRKSRPTKKLALTGVWPSGTVELGLFPGICTRHEGHRVLSRVIKVSSRTGAHESCIRLKYRGCFNSSSVCTWPGITSRYARREKLPKSFVYRG